MISYAVGGRQYVAATVGGPTENPSTVAGPLRVVVYGLHSSGEPKVVTLPRLEPAPAPGIKTAGQQVYGSVCAQCHGPAGTGSSAPPFTRQSQLADPKLLKQFLAVPPPMPRLYPGVLTDHDVKLLAGYLKTEVFKCGSTDQPQRCKPPVQPTTGGTPAWRAIYSVLTHPRCINCHPVSSKLPPFGGLFPQDYPRQGDDRHPHLFNVLRGETVDVETAEKTGVVKPGIGTPFARCTFCHGKKNDPVTGIPGTVNSHGEDPTAPFWLLAPAKMAWESAPGVPLTGAKLCAQLKDKSLNGNRELKDTLHHLRTEPLVHWAFSPGKRPNGEARTTPPISHEALIQAFKKWMAEGTPCPDQ